MSDWISVEDRRPKGGAQVIWYHPQVKGGRNPHPEYYRVESYDLPSRPATHWMPRPPPPEEGADEH